MSNGKALGVAMSKPTLEEITLEDGGNIIVNTTTGSQIGTSASQKLATYGKIPVVQASAIVAVVDAVSLTTTINAILSAIRNFGIIA